LVVVLFSGTASADGPASEFQARHWREHADPAKATLRIRTGLKSAHSIPPQITGKFAEHLGWNIYNGMDA